MICVLLLSSVVSAALNSVAIHDGHHDASQKILTTVPVCGCNVDDPLQPEAVEHVGRNAYCQTCHGRTSLRTSIVPDIQKGARIGGAVGYVAGTACMAAQFTAPHHPEFFLMHAEIIDKVGPVNYGIDVGCNSLLCGGPLGSVVGVLGGGAITGLTATRRDAHAAALARRECHVDAKLVTIQLPCGSRYAMRISGNSEIQQIRNSHHRIQRDSDVVPLPNSAVFTVNRNPMAVKPLSRRLMQEAERQRLGRLYELTDDLRLYLQIQNGDTIQIMTQSELADQQMKTDLKMSLLMTPKPTN